MFGGANSKHQSQPPFASLAGAQLAACPTNMQDLIPRHDQRGMGPLSAPTFFALARSIVNKAEEAPLGAR
jgi:hypothetical protein